MPICARPEIGRAVTGVPVRAILPSNVDGTQRVTDKQVLDLGAAVDENRFGVA